MWMIFAVLSAVFAALTSILAKIGIEGVNSNLATAIRTIVVVIMAWGMVFLTHAQNGLEEIRCIVERFVITLLNLQIIGEKDFEKQISGAVWLNADGRKKVLSKWQEKKRTDLMHPYLKQKIPFGLLPYVQSNLLDKYIRGDIESYPPYLQK